MTATAMDASTALYRLFDASGRLLYVGITFDVTARMRSHSKIQDWWPLVATRTEEWFPTRDDAEIAEERAINDEMPVFNKTKYRLRHPGQGGDGSSLAVISELADEYRRATEAQKAASDRLGDAMRRAFAADEKQSEILKATGHVWSREYLRIVLGLNKQRRAAE